MTPPANDTAVRHGIPVRASVTLSLPAAGQAMQHAASPDTRFILGFPTDAAALERSGDDLVFSFPDGGRIVLAGFFGPEGSALPEFEMPEGGSISGHDFLAALEPDLLPAAGPAAGGGVAGGGVGDYSDDSGALIAGVERLDPLTPFFWNTALRPTPDAQGTIDPAAGTLGFSLRLANPDGSFTATLHGFEDNQPNQHQPGVNAGGADAHAGDASDHPLQLVVTFTPADNETLDQITLSGFTAGTVIGIGSPDLGAGNVIVITDPAQQVTLTAAQLASGVYLRPPQDDATDMTITATARISDPDSGLGETLSGSFVLVVDAVADRPALDAAATPDHLAGAEQTLVDIPVSATFFDLDGSERHFVQVEGVPADWSLTGLPAGWTLVATETADGLSTLRFDVSDAVNPATGAVTGNLAFDPRDWSDTRLDSGAPNTHGPAELTVTAIAQESAVPGESTANDKAVSDATTVTVSRTEDAPTITVAGGNALRLVVDESAGPQHGDKAVTDLTATATGVLAALGLADATPLTATDGKVSFNLHTDGTGDPHPATASGQESLAWNIEQIRIDLADLKTADGGAIEWSVQTVNGHSVLVGQSGGTTACVAILADDDGNLASGVNTATVTFLSYQPLSHSGAGQPDDARDLPLSFTVTDDEGDATTAVVRVSVHDDAPVALPDTAAFSEAVHSLVTGNVLGNDTPGIDGWAQPSPTVAAWGGITVADSNGATASHAYRVYDSAATDSAGSPSGNAVSGTAPLAPGAYHIWDDTTDSFAGTLTLNADGGYTFTRAPGQDISDSFQVKVNYTTGTDNDGDAANSTLTINVTAAPRLELAITGDSAMHEDPQGKLTAAGWNTSGDNTVNAASYKIAMNYAGRGDAPGDRASGTFSFDVTLKDVSPTPAVTPGKVHYEGDPSDNAANNITGVGDITWLVPTVNAQGGITGWSPVYGANLEPAMNEALRNYYGTDAQGRPYVTVDMDSALKLTFTVRDGAPLKDLPLSIKAVDDMVGDSGERYTVVVGNLTRPDTTPDSFGVAITGNSVTTTIQDEGNGAGRDGFRVGLVDTVVQESDKGGGVEVRLYAGGDGSYYTGEKPAQDITLTLKTTPGSATRDGDYFETASHTIKAGQWTPVTDPDTGKVLYYKAQVPVSLADDRLSEGDETFTLTLTNVSGHEAGVYPGTGSGSTSSATVTIADDTAPGHTGKLDGPRLEHFGPETLVREPVAPGESANIGADGSNATATGNTVGYSIVLTEVAAQDVVVWLKLDSANLGKDFRLGENVYDAATATGLPGYANKPGDANYYVIVKAGEASARFTVDILHDHDTANVDGGVDSGTDAVQWTIVGMQGSEVVFTPGEHGSSSKEPIIDDMRGPVVAITELDTTQETNTTTTIKVGLANGVTANEDVMATLQLVDSKGNVYEHDVLIPKGAATATLDLAVPQTDYYHVRVVSSEGGETRFDDGFRFVDVRAPGTGGSGHGQVQLALAAHDLHENAAHDGMNQPLYTITGKLPAGYAALGNGDLSFSLKTFAGSAAAPDDYSTGVMNVTVDKGLLALAKLSASNTFTLDILEDGSTRFTVPGIELPLLGTHSVSITFGPDGRAAIFVDGASADDVVSDWIESHIGHAVTLGGTRPVVVDDTRIEGDEQFSTILTGLSGNATVAGDGRGAHDTTTIIDNDTPTVKVEVTDGLNAQGMATEGQDQPLTVSVSLVDAHGNPLSLSDGPVTLELTFSGTAVQGKDFAPYTTRVTIPDGGSATTVQVSLPDDYVSDGSKTLTVTARPVGNDPYNGYGDLSGWTPGTSAAITINDHANGPQATLTANRTSMTENGQSADFRLNMDKATEEDVTLSFRIDFKQGPDGNGFDGNDLAGVRVGTTLYRPGDSGPGHSVAEIVENGDVVGWRLDLTVPKGASGAGFSVVTRNDYQTEGTESFTVSVANAADLKGEMTLVSTAPITVNVTDTLDGPRVSLRAPHDVDEGDTADVSLALAFPKAPYAVQESFTVTLKVNTETLEPAGHGPNGPIYKVGCTGTVESEVTVGPDGVFTVTVPAGAGPDSVKVHIPTADTTDITGANPPLHVSIVNVGGGEASVNGAPSMSSSYVEEGVNHVTYTVAANAATQVSSTVTYTLGGVASVADVASVRVGSTTVSAIDIAGGKVAAFSIGATRYTWDAGTRQFADASGGHPPVTPAISGGKLAFSLPQAAGAISTTVTVTFKDNGNSTANRQNLTVNGSIALGPCVVEINDTTQGITAGDLHLVVLGGAGTAALPESALLAAATDHSPHPEGMRLSFSDLTYAAGVLSGLAPGTSAHAYTVSDLGDAHDVAHGTLTTEVLAGRAYDAGSAARDMIVVGTDGAPNHIVAGSGSDHLFGGNVNDALHGGAGNDHLHGGDGTDALYGGTGNDTLHGGSGDDALYGEAGNDIMFGDAGNDALYGGAGNDRLDGGTGRDALYGGEGNDTLVVHDTFGNDGVIDSHDFAGLHGGAGHDTLLLADADVTLDFTRIDAGSVTGIEAIDLTANGAQAVTLSAADLLDLGHTMEMGSSLTITGTGADAVNLSGTGWTSHSTRTVDGMTFNVFTASDASGETQTLLVQHEIIVNTTG